ncbi:hypothetical protein DL93DRAFT_2152265 [Clavulina sp. PMI_390]|nr:hypothetical protein DL93DRAFT_2152265 [Clavulina sp. PMI_390]
MLFSPRSDPGSPNAAASLAVPSEQKLLLQQFGPKFTEYSAVFNAAKLIQHLKFYRAVHSLVLPLSSSLVEKEPNTGFKSPSAPVRLLLTKGLVRFETWIDCVVATRPAAPLIPAEVPPLDVLMIWHGYLLSPFVYDEDASFRLPALAGLPHFPLEHLEEMVDDKGEFVPSKDQILHWESATKLPFNVNQHQNSPTISCPRCNTSLLVPWTESDTPANTGTGYAERGFRQDCSGCQFPINQASLCTKKFVDDLIAVQELQEHFIAGTAVSSVGEVELQTAAAIAVEVIKTLGDPKDNLGERLGWSMEEVARRLANDPLSKIVKANIPNLLRPYGQHSRFSTDLVYKALLQCEFAFVSYERAMYTPAVLGGSDTKLLQDALRAYRLFIKLVLFPHLPKVYPTYGVDLVWHTHQLQGQEYKRQTRDLVGVFLDHRSVDQLAPTTEAFKAERAAWRETLEAAGISDVVKNGYPILPPAIPPNGQPPRPRRRGSSGCSMSASQALAEDSILAFEMLDEADSALRRSQGLPSAEQIRAFVTQDTFVD